MSNTKHDFSQAGECVVAEELCSSHTTRACPQGATPSNTAPAKYIDNQYIQPLRCAVDSLYLSFKGELSSDTEQKLSELKAIAQDDTDEQSFKAFLTLDDHKFEVKPKGAGKFPFVLKDNWFNIQLSKSTTRSMPMAYVQISSELLTFTPLPEILDHLDVLMNELGKTQGLPSISRLDLCMDFVCLDPFTIQSIDIQQWKTRATQIDRYHQHKKLTGWRIGKGQIMGRLYNKSLELLKSKKDYLKPLWQECGWNSEDDVWRIEFQMKRELLAEPTVSNPNNINAFSPMIWKYATTKWLQLVTPTGDTNESRWPTHPAWLEIAKACACTQTKTYQPVKRERLPNDQYLFINGVSAISSLMAREGITDLGEALGTFIHEAETYHANRGESLEDYLNRKADEKTLRYNTDLKDSK